MTSLQQIRQQTRNIVFSVKEYFRLKISHSSKERESVWQIVSNQRFVNDKLESGNSLKVFIYTQLYTTYNFISA